MSTLTHEDYIRHQQDMAQRDDHEEQMTNEEIDALPDGEFYHYMLNQDHRAWAKHCNRRMGLGLDAGAEMALGGWFANAMMAMEDRKQAQYIRARLDAEREELAPISGRR